MKSFNTTNFIKQFNFGKGFIKSKNDAKEYIDIGYKPERLLLHFGVSDDALQYILSKIATSKISYN